jgi:hypothetical protein
MDLQTTIILSIIGKAARVLAPCAGGRRHRRQGSEQQSHFLNEVKAKSEGGVLLTLLTDSTTATRKYSDMVTTFTSSVLPATWKHTGVKLFSFVLLW